MRCLDTIKHAILATDIQNHIQLLPTAEKIARMGISKEEKGHCDVLIALCMTAADLSDQTKDWETTKNTAVSTTYIHMYFQCYCLLYRRHNIHPCHSMRLLFDVYLYCEINIFHIKINIDTGVIDRP